jgi:release factor glutamine methyltransferase
LSDDELLVFVTERLALAGCVAAAEEAVEMLAALPARGALAGWLERREEGEPLAWITGRVDFGGVDVSVAPGVYVPRYQSVELARRAAIVLPSGGRAADLCTGAGAVAAYLRCRVPGAKVVGTDLDRSALRCALTNGVAVVAADVGDGLRERSFDVVTAVPPYVPTKAIGLLPADVQRFEPLAALDGGPEGLDVVRRVAASAARLLGSGGWVLVEIGGDQGSATGEILVAEGFENVRSWCDEEGDLRGIAARLA